jgi:hypothetical protein
MRVPGALFCISAAALLALGGCSQKARVNARLAQLEKAFAKAGASPLLDAALAAVRTNDYAGGVIVLETLKRTPGTSAEQLMAVHEAIQALTRDLVARAAKGDAKAREALAAIEKVRSQ